MNQNEVLERIAAAINRVLLDKGQSEQALGPDTVLLGGDLDIDSLDLSAIVVEMEGVMGFDPFAQGFIEFRTVRELAALYAPAAA